MALFKTRNRTFLAGIEAVPGVAEALTVGADAIKMEDPRYQNNFETDQSREVTDVLGLTKPVPAGGFASITGNVLMKGSGTPGTAPDWGVLSRSAAMSETLTGADIAGVAQAAADDTHVQLAAAAVSSDDQFKGMVIEIAGDRHVIVGSVAATDTVEVTPPHSHSPGTPAYTILANALYAPASSGLETATANLIDRPRTGANARLRVIAGAASEIGFTVPVRGVGRMAVTMRGKKIADSDIATPGPITADPGQGRPMLGAQVFLGATAIKSGISFALNNQIDQPDDPAAEFGYDFADSVERAVGGFILPQSVLVATRDAMSDFLAGTEFWYWTRWGTIAGNRLSALLRIGYSGPPDDEDVRGSLHDRIPFQAVDDQFYLCVH